MRIKIEQVETTHGVADLYINGQMIIVARCMVTHMGSLRCAVRGFGEVFNLEGKDVELVYSRNDGYITRFTLIGDTFTCVDRIDTPVKVKPVYTISERDAINIKEEFVRGSIHYGITALSKKYNIPAKVLSRFLAA